MLLKFKIVAGESHRSISPIPKIPSESEVILAAVVTAVPAKMTSKSDATSQVDNNTPFFSAFLNR